MAGRALRFQEASTASLTNTARGSSDFLAQGLLNDRYRIGELQINQQGQTVVDLDELGGLLGRRSPS